MDINTVIDQISQKYETKADNIFEAFHKHKQYYDP